MEKQQEGMRGQHQQKEERQCKQGRKRQCEMAGASASETRQVSTVVQKDKKGSTDKAEPSCYTRDPNIAEAPRDLSASQAASQETISATEAPKS